MDEYIERGVALAVIRRLKTPAKSPAQKDMLRTAEGYIQKIPAADVAQVRHGRWIYHPDDLFPGDSTQECSCCHEEEYLTLYNENYCPNCGAKMDGGAD